jgi:hypothetical protein
LSTANKPDFQPDLERERLNGRRGSITWYGHASSSLRSQALRLSGSTTALSFTIASFGRLFAFVLKFKGQCEALAMPVETLGEGCSLGWRVTVRCADGRTESPRSQSSRECSYRRELDIETLVWTRGWAFPLSRLESRLRCPRCGSRHVVVLYEPPRGATSIAGPRSRLVRSSTA